MAEGWPMGRRSSSGGSAAHLGVDPHPQASSRSADGPPRMRFASCILHDRMTRMARVTVLLCLAIAITLHTRPAHADPRTGYLAEQLKTNDDYRVRTQAALALGASGDDAAVKPLCDALGDSNVVGQGRGGRGARQARRSRRACRASRPRRRGESAPAVKAQIEKSIAALQGGGGGGGGGAAAARRRHEVLRRDPGHQQDEPLRGRDREHRPRRDAGEAPRRRPATRSRRRARRRRRAGQIVKSKRLKGFFLIATVEAPVYAGGKPRRRSSASACATYPDKSLQGEFAPKLTQSGTSEAATPRARTR